MSAGRPIEEASRSEIDLAYDNAATFPDVPQWRATWLERSGAMPIGPGVRVDLRYGPAPRQLLDIFPTGDPSSPTALFIHGGFWSRHSKETFRFTVSGIHAARCNAAFVGYSLAPETRMDGMVAELRTGSAWLFAHLAELGLAPRPLVVVGWSSGAQLAAMLMGEPHVAGGIGVSGVYDLAPMRQASINDTLRLDEAEAERNSPGRHLPSVAGPFVTAYGSRELPAFRAQSEQFHAAWTAAGLPGSLVPLAGHHHHSVLDELHRPEGRLVESLAALAVSCHRRGVTRIGSSTG